MLILLFLFHLILNKMKDTFLIVNTTYNNKLIIRNNNSLYYVIK
jgi:hypothetical protein